MVIMHDAVKTIQNGVWVFINSGANNVKYF